MSESTARPIMSLKSVAVTYKKGRSLFSKDRHNVFHDLSFAIYEGESLGVIGRNGAGKSTLLKLLAGVIAPDRGEIFAPGIKSALLSLGAGFNHQLSGRRNITINGMLLGFSRQEIEEKTDSIIEYSELGSAIDDDVKTYSAGMRARLGFSIAIQLRPDVLLIDEALGVGDAAFMRKSSQSLRNMVQSNQTVVLVSHQGATIKSLCDRAVWIEEGVLRKTGPADEVVAEYEKYITQAVENGTVKSG